MTGVFKLTFGLLKMTIALAMAIPITLFFFLLSLFHLKNLSAFEKSSVDFVEEALSNVGKTVHIYYDSHATEKLVLEKNPESKPGLYKAGELGLDKKNEIVKNLSDYLTGLGGELLPYGPLRSAIVCNFDNQKYLLILNKIGGVGLTVLLYDNLSDEQKLEIEKLQIEHA